MDESPIVFVICTVVKSSLYLPTVAQIRLETSSLEMWDIRISLTTLYLFTISVYQNNISLQSFFFCHVREWMHLHGTWYIDKQRHKDGLSWKTWRKNPPCVSTPLKRSGDVYAVIPLLSFTWYGRRKWIFEISSNNVEAACSSYITSSICWNFVAVHWLLRLHRYSKQWSILSRKSRIFVEFS